MTEEQTNELINTMSLIRRLIQISPAKAIEAIDDTIQTLHKCRAIAYEPVPLRILRIHETANGAN